MSKLSPRSIKNLSECNDDLRRLFERVAESFPCEVIEGHRGEAEQNEAFRKGFSKLQFPDGKHNKTPSEAVDAMPLPIDWNNMEAFILFAGFVLGTAKEMGIEIRWGGDWNRNMNLRDEKTLRDLVHFETL